MLIDQQLHEGSLLRCEFPRRCFLARTQADNRASDADRLARPQLQVPRQAIAFVEKAECRHAFRHRCPDLLGHRSNQIIIGRRSHGFFGGLAGCIFFDGVAAEPATAGQQDRRENRE